MPKQKKREKAKTEPTKRASSILTPGAPISVLGQKNGGLVEVGENNGQEEVNDFILCLGYLPCEAGRPVHNQNNGQEEVNDFILCLGY
jgi:hypothetical protein